MFYALIDHTEKNPKIENCINLMRNRIIYTDAKLPDVLSDKVLVEDFGKETLFLCYRAAQILIKDLV